MRFTRTTYQFGCLQRKERKNGPDVWVLRYRRQKPDGCTKLASAMIGTVEQYRTEAQAWKAAEVLRLTVNPDNPNQHGVSFGALIDRYIAEDAPERCSTREGYILMLRKYIKPRWGNYAIADVRSFAVEEWLKHLKTLDGSRELAPKTKAGIRSMMHLLYKSAMRWGFVAAQANPMGNGLVRIKDASKRQRQPQVLSVQQFHQLRNDIRNQVVRTAMMVAICLGLRCSELFALKWGDIDFERNLVFVRRGFVRGKIDAVKTRHSDADLPLDSRLAKLLLEGTFLSPFDGPQDWVFASPFRNGEVPYSPHELQQRWIRPAAERMGLGPGIGWHTFRHTFRTLLDETGAPIKVQQELMRHADIRTTLNVYGKAMDESKRKANSNVVQMVLARKKKA